MLNTISLQLRVGVDVGSRCHTVAIGLSDDSFVEEFEIPHTADGFREFFARVEACGRRHAVPMISVAMEGYNGHVRPLDSLVKAPLAPFSMALPGSERVATVQCQQSEAGAVQGDLSSRSQERQYRYPQDPGVVPTS